MNHVLVIGLGNISKRHRRNIRELYPDAVIYAQPATDRDVLQPIEDCDKVIRSTDEIENIHLDFAIVASPASFHAIHSIPLIRANVPVLIEKPVATRTSDVQHLIKERDKHGTFVSVAYCLRYNPLLQFARSIIESGSLGKIYHVSCRVGQDLKTWRPNTSVSKTVSVNANLGGGVLNELSHEFDYLMWIFGDLEAKSALLGYNLCYTDTVEELANIVLVSEKDIPIQVHLDFLQLKPQRYFEVISEKGTLLVDILNYKIILVNKEQEKILYSADASDPNQQYINMIENMDFFINQRESSIVSLEEAGKTVSLIEDIRKVAYYLGVPK